MAHIVATADSFGFGPAGKLLTVTRPLLEQGHRITFIGYGTAYQLGSHGGFQQSIQQSAYDPDYARKVYTLFQSADVLLSSSERNSVKVAQEIGLPVAYIDPLFWFWDALQQVDCYIKQNSPRDPLKLQRFGSSIAHLHGVGPIVDLAPLKRCQPRNQLLIALGGMEAPGFFEVGRETNYPYVMMDALVNSLQCDDFQEVLVTGNERIMQDFCVRYPQSRFRFMTLPHDQLVQQTLASRLVILTPGQEMPLEAFSYGIPTIFLPPCSFSQYLQLDTYIKFDVAAMALHLRDYYPVLQVAGMMPQERSQAFFAQLRLFEQDTNAQQHMLERLNTFLVDTECHQYQIELQKKYIQSLGENGLEEVLHLVTSLL